MITIPARILLTRIVTTYILVFLLMRLVLHVTPTGLLYPVISYPGFDIGVWLIKFTGLITLVMEYKSMPVFFDSLIIITSLGVLLFPMKRWLVVIFAICLYLLGIIYKMYSISNHLALAGFMLVMIPFTIKNETRFNLAWEAVRYFTCLVYFISFCWKLFTGSFFYTGNGEGAVRLSQAEYIYAYPGSNFTEFIQWALSNGWILNGGSILVFLLEGAMVIGFFTRRYDHLLFWIPIIVHLMTFVFIDISYLELLVLDISMLPIPYLNRLSAGRFSN